jgi:hypothetical protein
MSHQSWSSFEGHDCTQRAQQCRGVHERARRRKIMDNETVCARPRKVQQRDHHRTGMMQLLKNLNQVLRVISLVAAYLVEVVSVPVCMLHEFCNGAALKPT